MPRQARRAAGTRWASWRGAAGRGRGDADNDKLHDFTLDEASYEGAHERLVRRQRRAVHSAVLRVLNVISK